MPEPHCTDTRQLPTEAAPGTAENRRKRRAAHANERRGTGIMEKKIPGKRSESMGQFLFVHATGFPIKMTDACTLCTLLCRQGVRERP